VPRGAFPCSENRVGLPEPRAGVTCVARGGSTRVGLRSITLNVMDRPGEQPAVLALHGLAGNAREWDWLVEALSKLRFIAPDLRGHGLSDWADDYRLDSFVADTEALIHWLDIGPVVIVGHSLGGAIGISLAARRPDLVNGLIVVDIGPEFPESAVAYVAARQKRGDTFADPASAAAALRAANPFPTDEAIHHRIVHGLTEAGTWTVDVASRSQRGATPGRPRAG
jgi:pimeloyl-ACP methyl ester carboxylesterase